MKLENYFRRFGIRNGSGAESSVSAVHLHYRRSADRLRPEHHRRSRKDRRYCKRHENRMTHKLLLFVSYSIYLFPTYYFKPSFEFIIERMSYNFNPLLI